MSLARKDLLAGESYKLGSALNSPRLAIICDFPEESWPSMDLVAEMLLKELHTRPAKEIHAERLCPVFRRRVHRLPVLGNSTVAFNADRLINRLWDYRRYLRRRIGEFDLFHLCDHSYAHLVHALPAERTGVFCHDLDTFRCLLEPQREPRPRWFKAMARHILRGLQKAAVVFHTTSDVRQQIERHGLLDMNRLVQAPFGVCQAFLDKPAENGAADILSADWGAAPYLLHVGSCISRKRIDVLLNVFAAVRLKHSHLRLLQVGGEWTLQQRQQIDRLGIGSAVIQLPRQTQSVLAALYRRASLVLLTSDAEGFGLPVIEALACAAVVVASDIQALREVGAEAVWYCPVADVAAWVQIVNRLLDGPERAQDRSACLARAARFSWAAHAKIVLDAYRRLLQ